MYDSEGKRTRDPHYEGPLTRTPAVQAPVILRIVVVVATSLATLRQPWEHRFGLVFTKTHQNLLLL